MNRTAQGNAKTEEKWNETYYSFVPSLEGSRCVGVAMTAGQADCYLADVGGGGGGYNV